ncbi:MAG: type II toxin-antitoxin system prevent-host-death family antitoxin [Actinomycetota bacterium]|jgi:prevent-host-death family protein|nr:type II toxin-antitoxin system prevent-host-death family antitoxin [Actinomycetota bacterium]
MSAEHPPSPDAISHIGARDLRANLASHLRAAQAGHRVIVTVDGAPVAELGPVGGGGRHDSLEALVATGLLEAPRRTDRPAAPAATPLPAGLTSERALMELRGR